MQRRDFPSGYFDLDRLEDYKESVAAYAANHPSDKYKQTNTDMMSELKWTGPAVYIRNEIINLNSG